MPPRPEAGEGGLRARLRWLRRATPPTEELAEHEREIADALVRLRDTTAREVMTPRVDIVALEMPVDPDELARAVRESGHSRFPVYRESLDQLEGVLFIKDLFRMDEPPTAELIERRLRRPFLVPETRRVLELLQEMRQRRIAFAVVVDEYGGVEGVLTIKDLVGELVGDLHDEFDRGEDHVSRIDQQRWLADGTCPVHDLTEATGLTLPDGEWVTLGGFLYDRFGRIPVEGDVHVHEGWEMRVAEMDRRRIAKVVIRVPTALDAAGTLGSPAAAGNGK